MGVYVAYTRRDELQIREGQKRGDNLIFNGDRFGLSVFMQSFFTQILSEAWTWKSVTLRGDDKKLR